MKNLLLIFLILALCSCSKEDNIIEGPIIEEVAISVPAVVECDAEEILEDEGRTKFSSTESRVYLNGGECRSDEFSKSGKYSVRLDSTNKYGFGLKISDPKPGEFIRFTAWQKLGTEHGTIYVTSSGKEAVQKNRTHYNSLKRKEDGWVMHTLSVIVSPDVRELHAVVFSGGRLCYFDDFKVERLPAVPENELENKITIELPVKSKQKIEGYIKLAKRGEVILPEHKKYVKAYFSDGENRSKVKLKLKGDWTDHLNSGKVSCRIKMKNSAYHGMKTFSLQHPKTRNYLDEWIVHKMAEKEDLLTTSFEFVNVEINNSNRGVYALEEHFDKQLLESRNRREGPILKIDESGIWSLTYARMAAGYFGEFPFFENAQIRVFKEGRTMDNPKLKGDFEQGAKLLEMFKNGYEHPEELIDLNQMAKLQVIIDVCSGVHATAWHNRRFYFNPVTQKLEHILYDLMPFGYGERPPFIYEAFLNGENKRIQDLMDVALIKNEEYRRLYFENFERMSSVKYLDELFSEYQSEIDKNEAAIQIEEPSYLFDAGRFYRNAQHLRNEKDKFKALWIEKADVITRNDLLIKNDYTERSDKGFFEDIALNAYLEDSISIGFKIRLENFHLNGIQICGYESENWPGHVYELSKKIDLGGFESDNNSADYLALYKPKRFFFKASNQSRRYYEAEVLPWGKPQGNSTRMNLAKSENWKDYGTVARNRVVLSGDIEIDELIYYPEGIDVSILPGSTIKFAKSGGMIINGNLTAKGSVSSPINLIGEGKACQGITVLQADIVHIENLRAEGLSNLKHENWKLTGAITVYESQVNIENLEIIDADCEDALNLIRSDFNIKGLLIDGCKSDGFDADFCSGYLMSSVFRNTGNDCIDFSGSRVTIDEVYIQNSGDKGISGGEGSTLNLNNITIDGAITGIASKDKSHVYGENVSIKHVDYSLMVFQKKPEYGPAQLQLMNSQIEGGVEVIDLKSILTVNGEVKEGVEKVDVDKLYARFN